jgi:predicted nucleic acid-binding protein
MTPDVNVLLAAARCDHPHYTVARNWLEQAVTAASRGTVLTLQPMVVASFLRRAQGIPRRQPKHDAVVTRTKRVCGHLTRYRQRRTSPR